MLFQQSSPSPSGEDRQTCCVPSCALFTCVGEDVQKVAEPETVPGRSFDKCCQRQCPTNVTYNYAFPATFTNNGCNVPQTKTEVETCPASGVSPAVLNTQREGLVLELEAVVSASDVSASEFADLLWPLHPQSTTAATVPPVRPSAVIYIAHQFMPAAYLRARWKHRHRWRWLRSHHFYVQPASDEHLSPFHRSGMSSR